MLDRPAHQISNALYKLDLGRTHLTVQLGVLFWRLAKFSGRETRGLSVFVEGVLEIKVGSLSHFLRFLYFKVNIVYGLSKVQTVRISGYASYEVCGVCLRRS